MKNGLDEQYINLLKDILENGVEKNTRNGKVLSLFGRSFRYKFKDDKFPLLTTKKMPFKTMVAELLWFLRGDTNIKFLLDYDCHIWDGDVYKKFLTETTSIKEGYESGDMLGSQQHIEEMFSNSDELTPLTKEEFINKIKTDNQFAKKWGELGPIYGAQWRRWERNKIDRKTGFIEVDQISNLIKELKTNPDSRRLMVSAWNVGELNEMVLPPCHYGFQVYTRKLTGEEMWDLLKKKVGEERFKSMVGDVVPFGGGLSEELESYKIPKRAISLMWNQRSVDTPLGLPFNIASYGLLLEIIAKELDMVPDELIGNLGDCHIYLNQIEGVKEQIGRDLTDEERYNKWFNNNVVSGMERFFDPNNLPNFDDPYYEPTPKRTREPFELPTVTITERNWYLHDKVKEHMGEKTFSEKILSYRPDCFELNNYKSHSKIKMPLSN